VTALPSAAATLALVVSAAASPSPNDGSRQLECRVDRGYDCLPHGYDCKLRQPEASKPAVFKIDFAKKEMQSPFRTAVLTVTHTVENADSLVLQGSDSLLAWSALINKNTSALTVSISDREGGYVIFARCKYVAAAPQ
jgi:hypothetical protein